MKVTRLEIANFRAFANPQTLELAPLTLVYGYNHAGKSALIRALPLLADSATGLYPAPLALDSPSVRDASFDDLRCRAHPELPVRFGLTALRPGGTLEWTCEVAEWLRPRRQYVTSWTATRTLEGSSSMISGAWDRAHGVPGERQGWYRLLPPVGVVKSVQFEGLVPILQEGTPEILGLLDETRGLLRGLRGQLQWLGSVRRSPGRRERIAGAAPLRMDPDGAGAAQMLAADAYEGGELSRRIAAFYAGAGLTGGYRFWVELEAEIVRLKLAPSDAPTMWTDLVDAGEGMVQVLPVLVALARAARGRPDDARLVALEQPELHLHPRLEVQLGEHLCEVARAADPPTVLVETHSEVLLLTIQRALLAGRLAPDQVAVYWVRQLPEGESVVERVGIDAEGRLDARWPPGTFLEASDLAREVVLARRKGQPG